jgi:hypothetical protein
MMRSLLAWVVYGLIPNSGGLIWRPGQDGEGAPEKSIVWTIVTGLACVSWLGLLMYLSTVWRDRLDPSFIAFAQFAEEVMLGKKTLLGPSSVIRYNVARWSTWNLEKGGEGSDSMI